MMRPFAADSTTIVLAVTSASADAALPAVGNSLRLVNEGPNNCYVSIGSAAQTATKPAIASARTCTPVLAGEDIVLTIACMSGLHIAGICQNGGTSTLNVSVGEGE